MKRIKGRKRKQQVRNEIRHSIRSGNAYSASSLRESENALDRKQETTSQEGESTRRSERLSKKGERSHFFRLKVVGACMALVFIALSLSSVFASEDSSVLRIGASGILDSFSLSLDPQHDEQEIAVSSNTSWVGNFSNDLPQGYEDEIALGGDSGMAVSSDGRTIGFTYDASLSETMATIQSALEEKGWAYVASGQESVATFVKDDGRYRWLAVTCVALEGSTSVVLVPGEVQPDE